MERTKIAGHDREQYGSRVVTSYAIRSTTEAERHEFYCNVVRWSGKAVDPQFVLERKTDCHSPVDGGPDRFGEWSIFDYAATPEAAARLGYESSYLAATSVHPLHRDALAHYHGERRREIWRVKVESLAHGSVVHDLKRDATEAFHAALKRSRLYKAASQGKAPQAKIDALKAAIASEWLPRIERAERIAECAKRKIETGRIAA